MYDPHDPDDRPFNVLFVCTDNSARSLFAETLINQRERQRGLFVGLSAGTHPRGEAHPLALKYLRQAGMPTETLRSKSWDEFIAPGAPRLDFVITVCDNAASDVRPAWHGQLMTAHWSVEDPTAVEGSDAQKWQAFQDAYATLEARIRVFTSLPVRSLPRAKLQERLDAIGKLQPKKN